MQESHLLLMAIFSTHWKDENQNELLRRGRQRIVPHSYRQDDQCQQQMPEESEYEVE